VHSALQVAGLRVVPVRSPGSHVRHATWAHLRDRRHHYSIERTFTFVRHPVPWMKSVWRWINTEPGNPARIDQHVWHPFHCARLVPGTTFTDFVVDVYGKQPAWFTRMCEWYIGPPGHDRVPHIGKQERLAADLLRILQATGHNLDKKQIRQVKLFGKQHVNTTRQFGTVECEPWVIEMIIDQEREMMERFEYE